MVERIYGLAENGLKCTKNQEKPAVLRWPPSPLCRLDPSAFGGGLPGNFKAVVVLISPSSLSGVCCRWPASGASFGSNSHGSQMVQKWPNSVFMIWRVLPGVLELKMVIWGLGFHLASKFMFI